MGGVVADAVYVSTWPEERVLGYFWAMVRAGADRLEVLTQLGGVAVARPAGWDPQAVREASRRPGLRVWDCFGCRTRDYRLYWHHVIWVSHGGSAVSANLVALCRGCHARLHPWLPADRSDEHRVAWTSIGSLADAAAPHLVEVHAGDYDQVAVLSGGEA